MFIEFRKRKMELMENGNFRLFASNRKQNGKLAFLFAADGNGKRKF
jgi:hypothetical protein